MDLGHDRDISDTRIICIFAVNCHEVMGEKDGHFNSSLYAANGKLGWRLV